MLDKLIEKFRHNKVAAYVSVIATAFLLALIIVVILARNSTSLNEDIALTNQNNGFLNSGADLQNQRQGSGSQTNNIPGAANQNPDGSRFSGSDSDKNSTTDPNYRMPGTTSSSTGSTYQDQIRAKLPANFSNTTVIAPPKITFEKYSLETKLPSLPQNYRLHYLKKSADQSDALALAAKIGLSIDKIEDNGTFITISDDTDSDTNGVIILDKRNGMFSYLSGGKLIPENSSTDPVITAQNFINQIGYSDQLITCTTTYKKKTVPDVIFVECHRLWEQSIPILNASSILNLNITQRLSDLTLASVNQSSHIDTNIYDTSDNTDSFERPNAFNTITITLSSDQENDEQPLSVLAVNSTIRQINSSISLNSSAFKTPQTALEELRQGKSIFTLATPLGAGSVNVDDLTPNSQAFADQARITDFIITSLEQETWSPQDTSEPYYAIRGISEINGYDVDFVSIIPALKTPIGSYAVKTIANQGVLAATTDNSSVNIINSDSGRTLQYGTLGFENDPTPSPTPQQPTENTSCPPISGMYGPFSDGCYLGFHPKTIAETEKKCVTRLGRTNCFREGRDWYSICPENAIRPSMSTNLQRRSKAVMSCSPYGKSLCPTLKTVSDQINQNEMICQYIVTASPRVYIYSKQDEPQQFFFSSFAQVTYAQPVPDSKKAVWEFTAYPSGQLIFADGTVGDDIYYEYNAAGIAEKIAKTHRSTKAFNVSKTQLSQFVKNISAMLNLKPSAQKDLLIELERETATSASQYFKISFIEKDLIDQLLPVKISPEPDQIRRIFLYIEKSVENAKFNIPSLEKINDITGSSVIEIGIITNL